MQNNSNFIPIRSGKIGQILKKDTERLLIDTMRETDDIIGDPQGYGWRQKRKEAYRIMANAENWAHTIFADFDMSRGYGNPDYYPPVPEYRVPKGRSYTGSEIAEMHQSQNNTFIRDNIEVSTSPIRTDEMDTRFDLLSSINPGILLKTTIHSNDIDIITGSIHSRNFSYPEITSYVGYMVSILTHADGKTELGGISVYKHPTVIAELLEFLRDMRVENMENMIASQKFLSTIGA